MASGLDGIVDDELEALSPGELAGGYRAICAMVLCRTAVVASTPAPPRRQEIEAKAIAKQWLAGEQGVISFPEACMAVSLDPDSARKRIAVYADPDSKEAISRRRRRPRNHYVFGRRAANARPSTVTPKSDSPAPRVGASPAHSPSHRICPSRPGSGC